MRLKGWITFAAILLIPRHALSAPASAQSITAADYEITLTRDSTQQGNNGSSGDTHDQDTLIEHIIQKRADGQVVEYSLPKSGQDNSLENWMFPVRVFEPVQGPLILLNEAELSARLKLWLKDAGLTQAACGHLFFTWNAFRIECDPKAVLVALQAYDLKVPDIGNGVSYIDTDGLRPASMTLKSAQPSGSVYVADLTLNPDVIRHSRVLTDMAVAEIMHKSLSLDVATRDHANDDISGTIVVTLDVDPMGEVWRRKRVTRYTLDDHTGHSEIDTIDQTLGHDLITR